MKAKGNLWSWAGLVIGVVMFIVGIVFFTTPPNSYDASIADRASFGADFYTYQYEVTRVVSSNVSVTANNIRELGVAISKYAGFFFIAAGLLTIVHYGKYCFAKEIPPVQPEDTSTAQPEEFSENKSDDEKQL